MRILLAATSVDAFSGASKCLIELACILKEKGHSVTVSLPKNGGEIDQILTSKKIDTIVIREYQCWYKDRHTNENALTISAKRILNEINIIKFRKYIRSKQFDIVHVNALTSYVVGKAAIQEKIPVVWHIREFMEEDLDISFIDTKWSLKVLNKASCFIAISNRIKNKWSQIITAPMELVYDGVPVDSYYVKNKEEHQEINVLLYGRIVQGKGQLFFINAAKTALDEIHTACKFYFAGKIEDKEYFDECIDSIQNSGFSKDIKYVGEISDIKSLLQSTDIVCVCSAMEGFGRVTVESMLGKCLVIGAASGATVELIEDGVNGVLYRSDDIQDFSKKLVECVNNFNNYKDIVNVGQKYALSAFTDTNNANNILKIYKEIAKA